ncbi:MAG TPA: methyltransferase domain-containing protein [Rhizomicrobium sp.]
MTRDEVIIAAYRVLLGREPEAMAVEKKLAYLENAQAILKDFVGSREYAERIRKLSEVHEGLNFAAHRWDPPAQIDVDVSEPQLRALFARIQQEWSKLGETEPYWSVITQDDFKRANFEKNKAAFFESGDRDAKLLDVFAQRAKVAMPRGTCLELGCGVGRITRYLADRFERVIAVDVSPGNLALCQQYLESTGKRNVETRQLKTLTDLESLPTFDVLFSLIVLQHNPPPIIKYALSQLLPRTNRGGLALFQVPTNTSRYSFAIDKYLKSPIPPLEMHAIPMRVVYALMLQFGFRPLETLLDDATGQYGSYTFFAIRQTVAGAQP